MVKEGNNNVGYNIEKIYQGGYSSFTPSYGDVFTGYRIAASELGAPTKPDTANQIAQVDMLLRQGIVPIEVGALKPEVFDQIPKQHFKEINQLAKITGAKISVHAPLIEPSGFTEQGWSEENRKIAEQQLKEVVERSHDLDDKGGMPITIHSAGIPGTEYTMTDEGKKISKYLVVNKETGKIAPIEEELKFYPGIKDLKKGEIYSPEKELESLNDTEWINSITNLEFYKKEADEVLSRALVPLTPVLAEYEEGKKIELTPEQNAALQQMQRANIFLQNVESSFNALYNKAYKYGDENQRKKLKEISDVWVKSIEQIKKQGNQFNLPLLKSQLLDEVILRIRDVAPPQTYVPLEDFAMEHSSETFSNVAVDAYKEYGKKAPTLSIENLYPGMAFSNSKEFKELIKTTKEKFVKKAVSEGISRSEAERQADKIIGVTLDVGHLNIARKKGFKEEDLAEEVKEIAKYVKHVHLTDNFGYSDSHLPPGMGNVPFKKILEILEKAGFKGTKIVEAGGFVQQF